MLERFVYFHKTFITWTFELLEVSLKADFNRIIYTLFVSYVIFFNSTISVIIKFYELNGIFLKKPH